MFQSGRPRWAFLLAAALFGAATGHALDARSPDAEIRRFAAEGLPDGPPPDIAPPESPLLSRAGCAVTAADDVEAVAIVSDEDRLPGYEPASAIRGSDDRSAVVTSRQPMRPAYRLLRRGFFRCDSTVRAAGSGAVGWLARGPAVEDARWLARIYWTERFDRSGERLLEERVDDGAEAVTVRRTTTVHGREGVQVREWTLSVRRSDGLVRVSDDLVRTVPPACPAAALASGRATASPLRLTVAVEPGAPPATSSQVVARLSNHSEEHVVVTLSACPAATFFVDDAAGRTVSGRVSGACADASTYLIHPGSSYAIASANWPLPGSHTLAPADYSVRAALEEWSCGSDWLPAIESERAVVRIGALPVRPQAASGSW